MGKTERRNVSQKKKSPIRTTLKLRKEKKMKGGELTDGNIGGLEEFYTHDSPYHSFKNPMRSGNDQLSKTKSFDDESDTNITVDAASDDESDTNITVDAASDDESDTNITDADDTGFNESANSTNVIEETNEIKIKKDEELVTLNITDQEGHIIYSYILKFTRDGDSDKSKGAPSAIQALALQTESHVDSDSNKLKKDEVTNDDDIESNTPDQTRMVRARSKSLGGSGGKITRDSINEQFEIPKTVLTAKMNEPFTINDNSFIISN